MGAHDGAVDHGVFVVGLTREMLEDALPHTRLGPAAEAPMHLHTVTEALRQVAPGYAGPVAVEYRRDEQAIVGRRDTNLARLIHAHNRDSLAGMV